MSMIVFNSIQNIGINQWQFSWSGTAPFRVYLDGVYFGETSSTSLSISYRKNGDEAPALEIYDSTDSTVAQNTLYPSRMNLQWRGISGVFYYRIDQYVDSEWTEIDRIPHSGEGYYLYLTEKLADETEHQFRIVAVTNDGGESLPLSFPGFIIKNPDPPQVNFSYAAGQLTIDED